MTSSTTSAPTSIATKSGTTNIDSILGPQKWGGGVGSSANLTYSFPWQNGLDATFAGPNGTPYSSLDENLATQHFGFNSVQKASAVRAVNAWQSVANIKLTEVTESNTNVGDIRFAFTSATVKTSTGTNAWGWAKYPNSYWPSAGDIWVNTESSDFTNADWSSGSNNFNSLLHEIGHAIGLKHPFEDAPQLPSNLDSMLYTVMSYTTAPNDLFGKLIHNTDGSVSYNYVRIVPETPMLLDIASTQYLYGANNSYKTGDDVYTFDPHTPFFKTIWDAGGSDTISVSNFTEGCEINLNAGSFSKITIKSDSWAGYNWKITPTPTYDGTNNLCIAYNVVIENAIGGYGNDILTGNSANNSLVGGPGNDIEYGGDGNDTFDWDVSSRGGNDTFYGGKGDDDFVLDSSGDTVVEFAGEGNDTIWVAFSYSMSNVPNIENLYGFGSSNLTLTGNAGSNHLRGSTGNDTLDGGGGIDYAVFSDENFSDCTITGNYTSCVIKTKSNGTDTLKNIKYAIFADKTYDISSLSAPPTYALTSSKTSFDEGTTALFNLTTTNVNSGTILSYVISGISSADLTSGILTGEVVVGSDGKSTISIGIKADNLTEGPETLTVTLSGISAFSIVNDTSKNTNTAATSSSVKISSLDIVGNLIPDGGKTFTGTDVAETINGTNGGDWIYGYGGNDTLYGLSGMDLISGMDGNDYLSGGDGEDFLDGGRGDDEIYGGKGNDTAYYDGIYSNFKITTLYDSKGAVSGYSVKDTTGIEGTDTIHTDVEYLDFSYGRTIVTLDNGVISVSTKNSAPSGSVTISGTLKQNQILSASNNISDSDGLGAITYTWSYSPDNTDGSWKTLSTGATLTLTESLVGKYIFAYASYTDAKGYLEAVSSFATSSVANVNDLPAGSVTVSGTAKSGQTLTAANNITDLDGIGSITYQWQQSTDAYSWTNLSTGPSLILGDSQNGKFIKAIANYTDGHGTAESVTSISTTAVVSNNVLSSVLGTSGNDTLLGTSGNDTILAYAGNDQIIGSSGNDTIDGGAGIDIVSYDGKYSSFLISKSTDNIITLSSSTFGTDTLTNIERIKFSDKWYATDTDGNAGTVAKVIIAAFGKAYVTQFMATGLGLADSGKTLDELCSIINNAKLVETISGDSSVKGYVASIFQNVIGRAPNLLEAANYEGMLSTGAVTKNALLSLAANTSFVTATLDSMHLGLIGIPYDPGF